MKRTLIALAVGLTLATGAHAQDWLTVEAGIGAADATSLPGVWQQSDMADDHERLLTPAYLLGLTGDAYDHGNWSLHWHADYVYLGNQSASCECETDAAYESGQRSAETTSFSGSGHIQGAAFTLEPGYTWRGTRFSVEGGPFLFFTTWNENTQEAPYSEHAFGGGTLGYVVGARVEHGHFGLSYRLYRNSPQWRAYPGLVRQESVLMLTYKY
jgi:hypothetical protein